MKKGRTKQFFAGGNTAYGFYSLFHYIPRQADKRLIIIKGGPGTGKSTFMKGIGNRAVEQGFDIEQFYCSSDHNSLDGLAVPSLGFAVVDGTAPHVIDPMYPGARDEIINLGRFWNSSVLQQHKEEITDLIRQGKTIYPQAYQYLKEANVVMEKLRYLMSLAMDYFSLSQMSHQLLGELVAALPPAKKEPVERHLFAGAVSSAGLMNFYPSILEDCSTLYLLTGDPGTGKSYLLQQIYETVRRAGHDLEVYPCPFDPDRLDAVVIPVLQTAFAKAAYPHSFSLAATHPLRSQITLTFGKYARVSSLRSTAGEQVECAAVL
jgi:Cdc6-like AAA superfamily ATPase